MQKTPEIVSKTACFYINMKKIVSLLLKFHTQSPVKQSNKQTNPPKRKNEIKERRETQAASLHSPVYQAQDNLAIQLVKILWVANVEVVWKAAILQLLSQQKCLKFSKEKS